MSWQLQEAKAKLSQLIQEAQRQPQVITLHGRDKAVVLSVEAYEALVRQQDGNLADFFRKSPWAENELTIERSDDRGRDIAL